MFSSTRDDYLPWLNVTASFALGALCTWLAAGAMQRMRRVPGPISDDVVRKRVLERVESIVSEPQALNVTVENGVVRLAGELPAIERDQLLTQLVYMPGVMRLRNALSATP